MFKKFMKFIKNLNYKKTIKMFAFILYTLCIVLITYAVINTYFKPEPEVVTVMSTESKDDAKIDIKVLEKTLKENAHLSTAELKFKAEADYSDVNGIPGITQTKFTVLCEATVKAGFDVNDVLIEANDENKIVYITVPLAEIKPDDIYINHQSLKFFDKKFVLFPVDVQEHTAKALALAENIANNYAQEMGIIEMANKQGAVIIKGILSSVIPDGYKIEVKNSAKH